MRSIRGIYIRWRYIAVQSLRRARMIGFMALVSYMIVILFTWIFANMQGYMYFSAGIREPFAKYLVWSLGFLGFFVAYDCLREELDRNYGLEIKYRIIRVIGLMALISYMIVILSTWIIASSQGFIYFSAGEPVLSIKYPEWILGFIAIFVSLDYLHKGFNDPDSIYVKQEK